MAMTVSTAPTQTLGPAIIVVADSGTSQVYVRLNPNLTISLLRGGAYNSDGTVLATSTAALTLGVFAYVEFKGVIDPSTGSVSLHVNGVAAGWPTFSGNTRATANSTWNSVAVGNAAMDVGTPGVMANIDLDDLYVLDQSGSAPWNDFLGDCRVDPRYPTAAGATTGWTPSAGANWSTVKETAPNGDTDYNSTSTVGVTDTFTVQDVAVPGATVYGVQHCLSMKKMDAGACTVAPVVRPSGTDYVGADITPSTAYSYGLAINQTNPATGVQWTEAGFNAAEFGYKKTT